MGDLPAGVFPAKILFNTSNFPLKFIVPWSDLAITLLALPAIAYVISLMMTIRRPSRAATTMIFVVLSFLGTSAIQAETTKPQNQMRSKTS